MCLLNPQDYGFPHYLPEIETYKLYGRDSGGSESFHTTYQRLKHKINEMVAALNGVSTLPTRD